MNQWDREREQLERDLMRGLIGNVEYNKQMREINRDEQLTMMGEAQDAAERAYNDVLGNW